MSVQGFDLKRGEKLIAVEGSLPTYAFWGRHTESQALLLRVYRRKTFSFQQLRKQKGEVVGYLFVCLPHIRPTAAPQLAPRFKSKPRMD
jgi:hypothetical protein